MWGYRSLWRRFNRWRRRDVEIIEAPLEAMHIEAPIPDLSILDITDKLIEKLTAQEQHILKSIENVDNRLERTEELLEQYNLWPLNKTKKDKDDYTSLIERNEGFVRLQQFRYENFMRKRHECDNEDMIKKIFHSYNKSIAFAESKKLLTLAYAYRALAFLYFQAYKECLRDIDFAKESPNELSTDIKIQEQIRDATTKCNRKNKKYEKRKVAEVKKCVRNLKHLTELTYEKHEIVKSFANCLELHNSPESGRQIKTNRKLNCGDVISIEKAFVCVPTEACRYICCSYCLKVNFSLIPCSSCSWAMFCNQKCMKKANQAFHRYECKMKTYLIGGTESENLSMWESLNIRTVFQAILMFTDINKLIAFDTDDSINTDIFSMGNLVTYDSDGDDEDDEDDDDVTKDYIVKMNAYNYYPMQALLKGITEAKFDPQDDEIIRFSVHTVITSRMLIEKLEELNVMKGHDHRRFIRNFVNRIYTAIYIYSHQLYSTKLMTLLHWEFGSGIYTCSDLMNHSCAPNIARINNGSTLIVVVTRPIQKGDEVFDCYGERFYHEDISNRQRMLKNCYRFDCNCEACENDYQLFNELDEVTYPPILDESKVSTSLTPTPDEVIKALNHIPTYLNTHYTKVEYPNKHIIYAIDTFEQYFRYFINTLYSTKKLRWEYFS